MHTPFCAFAFLPKALPCLVPGSWLLTETERGVDRNVVLLLLGTPDDRWPQGSQAVKPFIVRCPLSEDPIAPSQAPTMTDWLDVKAPPALRLDVQWLPTLESHKPALCPLDFGQSYGWIDGWPDTPTLPLSSTSYQLVVSRWYFARGGPSSRSRASKLLHFQHAHSSRHKRRALILPWGTTRLRHAPACLQCRLILREFSGYKHA